MEDGQIEEFLAGIDYGLLAFKDEFLKKAVTSDTTLRFLRPTEVREMNIPKVYQRLLISKIVELQTPETKSKLKRDAISPLPGVSSPIDERSGLHQPKRLFPDPTSTCNVETRGSRNESPCQVPKSSDAMEKETKRLTDERNDMQAVINSKKEDINILKSKPVQPRSLPIPGLPVINVACDNCHHKGHRASGNRGGTQCPYVKCPGFHYCGLEAKHREHRQQVCEAEKEVQTMEKKVKSLNAEIESIKCFIKYNNTNFVTALRPKLLEVNAGTLYYKGKDGKQNLNRDLRLIKIATGGKVPSITSKEALQQLVQKGKAKVSSVCDPFDDSDDHDLTDNPSNIRDIDSINNNKLFMAAQIQTNAFAYGSPYNNFYPMMYQQGSQPYMSHFGYPYHSNVNYGMPSTPNSSRNKNVCATAPNPFPPLPVDEPHDERPPLPPSSD